MPMTIDEKFDLLGRHLQARLDVKNARLRNEVHAHAECAGWGLRDTGHRCGMLVDETQRSPVWGGPHV